MKHAGSEALDGLEDLLEQLRSLPQIIERKRGTFYKKSSAFLHFHEDPAGIFADVKVDGEFVRFEINTEKQRAAFVKFTTKQLSG